MQCGSIALPGMWAVTTEKWGRGRPEENSESILRANLFYDQIRGLVEGLGKAEETGPNDAAWIGLQEQGESLFAKTNKDFIEKRRCKIEKSDPKKKEQAPRG